MKEVYSIFLTIFLLIVYVYVCTFIGRYKLGKRVMDGLDLLLNKNSEQFNSVKSLYTVKFY